MSLVFFNAETLVNEAADFFYQNLFTCIAFPCFSSESNDAEIHIVQNNLEGVRVGTVFPDRKYFAYILFAVEFKGYGNLIRDHNQTKSKNIPECFISVVTLLR